MHPNERDRCCAVIPPLRAITLTASTRSPQLFSFLIRHLWGSSTCAAPQHKLLFHDLAWITNTWNAGPWARGNLSACTGALLTHGAEGLFLHMYYSLSLFLLAFHTTWSLCCHSLKKPVQLLGHVCYLQGTLRHVAASTNVALPLCGTTECIKVRATVHTATINYSNRLNGIYIFL